MQIIIESTLITVEDVTEHSPLDRQVRHHGYISTQGLWFWKWSATAPENSGSSVEAEWYGGRCKVRGARCGVWVKANV